MKSLLDQLFDDPELQLIREENQILRKSVLVALEFPCMYTKCVGLSRGISFKPNSKTQEEVR